MVLIWDDFLDFIFFPESDQNTASFRTPTKGRNEEPGLVFQAFGGKNFGAEG